VCCDRVEKTGSQNLFYPRFDMRCTNMSNSFKGADILPISLSTSPACSSSIWRTDEQSIYAHKEL
jgi:hypothetical protein